MGIFLQILSPKRAKGSKKCNYTEGLPKGSKNLYICAKRTEISVKKGTKAREIVYICHGVLKMGQIGWWYFHEGKYSCIYHLLGKKWPKWDRIGTSQKRIQMN